MDCLDHLSCRQCFTSLTGPGVERCATEAVAAEAAASTAAPFSDDVPTKHTFDPETTHGYHVTLVDKDEYRGLTDAKKKELHDVIVSYNKADEEDRRTQAWVPLGTGMIPKKRFCFVAVVWAFGDAVRCRLGLSPKDFHITVSRDVDPDSGNLYQRVDNHDVTVSSTDANRLTSSYFTRPDPALTRELIASRRRVLLSVLRRSFFSSPSCMTELTFYGLSMNIDDDDGRESFVADVNRVRGGDWVAIWLRMGEMMLANREFEGAKIAYMGAQRRLKRQIDD